MIRVLDIQLRRADIATRMPFRYGIATMTALPHLFVVAEIECDGVRQTGVSADHLPPKWFTKDPERDPADEIEDMLVVIRHAAACAKGLQASSVFELWVNVDAAQNSWGTELGFPPLLHRFGTALVERAIIDAFCRVHGQPFHQLLKDNAFGINLGALHGELANSSPADWLPNEPRSRVICRHTIGLSDPLRDDDILEDERIDDGLPQSLEACIQRYKLQHFKIKITSEIDHSVPRLVEVLKIIQKWAPEGFRFTLDGNESFQSVASLRDFWKRLNSDRDVSHWLSRCLFVEQPFHRDIALAEQIGEDLCGWEERPSIVIDESDATLDSLPTALRLGYVGTSHKNCKGVFKGLSNACLLEHLRSKGQGDLIMSGEDLSNIGPVALPQDLAVQAAFGNVSIERNGHHYFRGLSLWPESIQQEMLKAHPDLYQKVTSDLVSLNIQKGEIDLASVNQAPFGVTPAIANLGKSIEE